MARFLFSVWPAPGHLYPSLPIAHALRAAGHTVAYVTLPAFEPLLAAQDIGAFTLEYSTTEPNPVNCGPVGGIKGEMDFSTLFVEPALAIAHSVERAVDAFGPDVLVHDQRNWGPTLVAERRRLPFASLILTCCSLPGKDLAPFGLGLPPAPDDATRTRYTALHASTSPRFMKVKAAWNATRAAFGLDARAGSLASMTLSPDLLLLLGIREFDYDRTDLPPQAHYVGPCTWDPPANLDAETAGWLTAIPPELPLALVSASTATRQVDRGSAALVEAALAGLTGSGVAVLATLPFEHPLHDAPTPPFTRLVRFVPHSQVLPRTAMVITHGGFGTVMKALSYGLPLVVVPYTGDQPEVAQRVVTAEAGLRLAPATLTPAALRNAVTEVRNELRYRAGARRLAAAMSRHNGPIEAATLLTQLAARHASMLRTAGDEVGYATTAEQMSG